MQSSEEKSQKNATEMVSGRNEDHIKTEGLITTMGNTEESAGDRQHYGEDEGNEIHVKTCRYDNSAKLNDDSSVIHLSSEDHSSSLSKDLSAASPFYFPSIWHHDEAHYINYRPCDSDKGILCNTPSNSDDKSIIKNDTSDYHSSSSHSGQLTATAPDMSLQMSSLTYGRPSDKNSPKVFKARKHSPIQWQVSEMMSYHLSSQQHDKQMQSRGRGHAAKNSSPSFDASPLHWNWAAIGEKSFPMLASADESESPGDSEEELKYKKIATEGHLPHPNRPRAPTPPDHLDQ